MSSLFHCPKWLRCRVLGARIKNMGAKEILYLYEPIGMTFPSIFSVEHKPLTYWRYARWVPALSTTPPAQKKRGLRVGRGLTSELLLEEIISFRSGFSQAWILHTNFWILVKYKLPCRPVKESTLMCLVEPTWHLHSTHQTTPCRPTEESTLTTGCRKPCRAKMAHTFKLPSAF